MHAFTVKDGRLNRPQGENFKVHLELFKASIFGIALAVLSDVPATSGTLFMIAKFLVSTVAILSLCLGKTQGVCLLLIVLVSGRGLAMSESGEQISLASIWIGNLGPLTPSLIVFSLIVLHAIRNVKTIPSGFFRFAVCWFAIVPTLAGIFYGNFSDGYARSFFKSDLRLPLMLFLGWLVFSSVCKNSNNASKRLLASFFGALFARHTIDFIQSIVQTATTSLNHANSISLCPAKGLIIPIFYFAVLGILYTKRTFIFSLISTFSLYMLITYSQRHLYITALLGIFALPKLVSKKQLLAGMPIISTALIAAIAFLIIARPDTAHYVYLRSSTFFDPDRTTRGVDVDLNFFSAIDPIRYAEILNILHQSIKKGSIIWGQGYGGWYSESVAKLHIDLQNAYPPEQIASGRYFSAHDFPSHILLKYGIAGILILTFIWLKPINHALKQLKINVLQLTPEDRIIWLLHSALICTVPTAVLSLWWSGKGCLLAGLILALFSATPHFALSSSKKKEAHTAFTKTN